MNDQQQKQLLFELLYGEISTSKLRGGSPADIARALANRVVEEGWTPPAPPTVEEEWRVIPGFSAWEASNTGFIRHAISKVWVPISYTPDESVTVTLYDDFGRDQRVGITTIFETTWPIINGVEIDEMALLDILPEAALLGKSTPVTFEDDEWKDIDCIDGLKNFEINQNGAVRNKVTKRVRSTDYHEEYDMECVKLILNGNPIYIDGPELAKSMWHK